MWWPTGYWSQVQHSVLQSHWTIHLGRFTEDPANNSFAFFYAFAPGSVYGHDHAVDIGRIRSFGSRAVGTMARQAILSVKRGC